MIEKNVSNYQLLMIWGKTLFHASTANKMYAELNQYVNNEIVLHKYHETSDFFC